jgi:hypothetical protein
VIAVALATSGLAGEARARKPRFEVRTARPVSLTPMYAQFVAELVGGDDLEEYYCLGLLWEWGDGTRSYRESDCDPFEPGIEVDRLFSARHAYVRPGLYRMRVSLVRAGREVAGASTWVEIVGHVARSSWD